MFIPDIYQNDRDEKLNQKKIHAHDHAPVLLKSTSFSSLFFESLFSSLDASPPFEFSVKKLFDDNSSILLFNF